MTIDQVAFNKAKRVINLPAREQSVVALSECFFNLSRTQYMLHIT